MIVVAQVLMVGALIVKALRSGEVKTLMRAMLTRAIKPSPHIYL